MLVAMPWALAAPAALVTTHVRTTEPELPAVNVSWLVVVPAVGVPPMIDQRYVQPACTCTEAVRPIVPAVTKAGADMAGVVGTASTVMAAVKVAATPAPLVTVRV